MLFNSFEFLLFFPTVVLLFFWFPLRWRWVLLLAASYAFYAAARVEYALLLFASTAIDYFAARAMPGRSPRARRALLGLSLTGNLGMLFYFKYAGFFSASVAALVAPFGYEIGAAGASVLLPIGISFYTFQTLSYTFDVYRGVSVPEKHFGIFALYVSFFPQLVAGPIERAERLLPQFREVQRFNWSRCRSGVALMAWGFFQKLVVADRVAFHVNAIYNSPDAQTAGAVVLATYFFAFQIYADFAGYSNIAIGAARVMGFDLMANFRQPYLSTNLGDAWSRWHISLSTWFRDYVYAFLRDRNNRTQMHWARNIMIVFLAMGLWHGAAWHFVAFGAVTGFFLIAGRVLRPARNRAWQMITNVAGGSAKPMRAWIGWLVTFHLIAIMLLFFRANTLGDAFTLLSSIVTRPGWNSAFFAGRSPYELALAFAGIAVLLGVDAVIRYGRHLLPVIERSRAVRWGIIYATVFATLMFGEFRTTEFIYFHF